jgi:hypothetical protein
MRWSKHTTRAQANAIDHRPTRKSCIGVKNRDLYSDRDGLEHEPPRLREQIGNGYVKGRHRQEVDSYPCWRWVMAQQWIPLSYAMAIDARLDCSDSVSSKQGQARQLQGKIYFRPSTRRRRFVKGQVLSLGGGPNQHCDHQYDYPSHVYSIAHLTSNTKSGGVT